MDYAFSSSSSTKRKRNSDCFDEVNSCKRPKNDVFLNYSFEDIGKSFVSHLKGGLTRNGFTIIDRTMLPNGQDESFEIFKAIHDSEIYLLVFSINYPLSLESLDEFVIIMDCLPKFKKRKVFPIFYNVDPSHVRMTQEGSFMEAFQEHHTDICPERVHKWKQALKDAGQLSGLTFPKGIDEERFIENIVEELEKMQGPQDLHVTDYPVGIRSRADELISKLRLDCEDQVLVVGVFGISGIGKTTIVKATYNRIAAKFDVSCFLAVADIHYHCGRQDWKVKLQKKLLSYLTQNYKHPIMIGHNDGVTKIKKVIRGRKILMVLDDVDKFQQLEELGINPTWFYKGSRIIVTTRDRQSLGYIPYISYHTKLLNRTESLTLFIRLIFKRDEPINTRFIEEVVSCAGGLPLVIKVWSRHFIQYEKKQWLNILERLKTIPHGDVQKKLQMSYESLPNRSKKLFLDLVCFFDGMDKDLLVKILHDEDSRFFPDIEIQNLVDKSLVEIDNNKVSIHQAISDMGKEVIRQENEDEPGKRTRLKGFRDVAHVLRDCSGTKSVEGIRLDFLEMKECVTVKIEAFKKMRNLRFILLLDTDKLSWSSSSNGIYDEDMSSISLKKLKYLEWRNFPCKSIKNIDMANVVVIKLQYSKLEILWEGFKSLPNLRILDVCYSSSLTKTGNFIGLKKLEKLYLAGCKKLEELDSSIGCLENLVELDLGHCTQLKWFPWEMIGKLLSLVELNLKHCPNILNPSPNLPLNIKSFTANYCKSLIKLPFNMSELQSLTKLVLDGCFNLEPENYMKVTEPRNLHELRMKNCNLSHISSGIGNLMSLRILDLSRNPFSCIPDSFSNLSKLVEINIEDCSQLKSIPNLPSSIKIITASDCISLVNLSSNMFELQFLEELVLDGCFKLEPEGFMKVTRSRKLRRLSMRNCNLSQVPNEIENLVSLQYLNLSGNSFSNLPDSFSNLLELIMLKINNCFRLQLLPLLPPNLINIEASGCCSLDMPYLDCPPDIPCVYYF